MCIVDWKVYTVRKSLKQIVQRHVCCIIHKDK